MRWRTNMCVKYIELVVRPTIPAKCLTPVEYWLLGQIFETKKIGNYVGFSACWGYDKYWYGSFSPDEELQNALAASSKACPELCAAIQREIAQRGAILLGTVDYETIFQSVILRHPSLQHISIEECVRNPTSDYYDKTFTLITATEIELISTLSGNIHRSGPLEPESPYIYGSKDKDKEKEKEKEKGKGNVIYLSHKTAALRRDDDPFR